MKRNFRLTRSSEIQRVRRFGKSYAHPLIVLVALPNPEAPTRFAILAGRSLGRAVQRNRVRRLLRAALQPHLSAVSPGWSVLVIARRPMTQATFQETQASLTALLRQSAILGGDYDDRRSTS